MSYNVTIWSNTGFNVNNIPDSPALLGQGTSVQAVEIMQERYLSSIKISAEWANVKNVDYCKVGDMYYMVTGVSMLATDFAELALVPDFISSLGGVSQLTILDGITERCHLPNSVDGDKDDPLLTPHEALQLDYEVLHSAIESFGESAKFTVIETTVDLCKTMCWPATVSYKSGVLSDSSVEVPKQYGLSRGMKTDFVSPMTVGSGIMTSHPVNRRDTVLEIVDSDADVKRIANGSLTSDIPDQDGNTHKMGTTAFSLTGNTKAYSLIDYNSEYISILRGAGIESSIINKVEYPFDKVFVQECYYDTWPNLYEIAYGDQVETDTLTDLEKEHVLPHLSIKEIKGADSVQDSTIKYKYTSANNDILDFSDFTPYGLLTASGNKIETQPKNLVTNLHSVSANAAPKVRCLSDPNPDGAPYYGFKDYMGDDSLVGFMSRTARGMSWKQVPIVFTEKSGWLTDAISKRVTEDVNTREYLGNQALLLANTATSAAFGGMANVSNITDAFGKPGAYIYSAANGYMGQGMDYGPANYKRVVTSGTSQVIGAGMPIVNGISQALYNDWSYRQQMYSAGMKYALSRVTSPTLAFPYNSEPARQATDNGVVTYRLKYSANDIARIDKLITMYGVKTTRPLESSMFTSRRYFNYIACDDVTLTGHSRWMDEGAALQLKGGVRIWHVKPDPAKYLTENI